MVDRLQINLDDDNLYRQLCLWLAFYDRENRGSQGFSFFLAAKLQLANSACGLCEQEQGYVDRAVWERDDLLQFVV